MQSIPSSPFFILVKKIGVPALSMAGMLLSSEFLLANHAAMDNVVVTASGREQSIENVQASVQVINEKDMDKYAGNSIAEVMQQATGVQTRGGSVSIRGFNSNQSLILINGQRRTGNYGNSNLSQINMVDIERIEIVRGPLSSLYGADALGGVINVIKKHPGQGEPLILETTLGTAEDGRESVHTGVTANYLKGSVGHSLNLEQKYRNSVEYPDKNEDRLGRLEAYAANYRGHWHEDETASLEWAVEYSEQNNDRDALTTRGKPVAYVSFEEEQRQFYGLDYRRLIGAGELTLRTNMGETRGSTNRSYPSPKETTLHTQYQNQALYQWSIADAHHLNLGIGHILDELELTINSKNSKRNNSYALAQDEWNINDQWTLVIGARHDRVDDDYDATTPRLSLGWNNGSGRARMGYGEGFRAPTLLEQYASFRRGPTSLIQGNPNLKPEKSQSYELMLGYQLGVLDIEATAFHSTVDDLIDAQRNSNSTPALVIYEYHNIDNAQLDGVELNNKITISDDFEINLGYDWLSAEDKSSHARLEERAKHTYRAQADYKIGKVKVSLRNRYLDGYYAKSGVCVTNCLAYESSYNVTDINLQYFLSKHAELRLGVDNILNETEPSNFVARGAGRTDPGERYYYAGIVAKF
jgi:outer membrane receptor for ferrienterochelin and colicin